MQNEIDYIIVGQGFAGSFFAFELIQNNKSFIVIDAEKHCASAIAAGVFNPVILKRFTKIWKADTLLKEFVSKIKEIEQAFDYKILTSQKVLRIFDNEQEKITWKKKSKEKLKEYLDTNFLDNHLHITAPFGLGKVQESGKILSLNLLNSIKNYLKKSNQYINEVFDYELVIIEDNSIQYKEFRAKKIVFCEGINVRNNPFFKNLPIIPNKGECLLVQLSENIDNYIYKKKYFLSRENVDEYYVGGTYSKDETDYNPTENIRTELIDSLEEIYKLPYKINQHLVAIRPTTSDYRPIIGKHFKYNNLFIINGLGARGTLLGAYAAKVLYNFIENNIPIENEVDINRFF